MKWDFFYDEVGPEPYKRIQDWRKEITHLVWPTIVIIALGLALIIYCTYFHF